MPGSSDDMFIQKLYNTYINKKNSSGSSSRAVLDDASQYFSKPRTSTTAFNVHHYAYVVTYEKDLFTDKNIDSLIPEHLQILKQSEVVTNKELLKPTNQPYIHCCVCIISACPYCEGN